MCNVYDICPVCNICAGVKRITPMFKKHFACRTCEDNVGEVVEQEAKLCNELEAVRELTYLFDSVGSGGGFDAAVIA